MAMPSNPGNPPARSRAARRLVVDPAAPDPAAIAEAAAVVSRGGLVAFPTETVYGLGADALDAGAVARVFAAKGRPAHDPVIVHVLDAAGAARVAAALPPAALRLAAAFWPGPLTLVVPRGPAVPAIVAAGLDSVAIRAPAHPVARALIAAAGVPIAAPSANPFGRASPTTAAHVVADLGDRVDLVLDGGPCPIGVESTVVDCLQDPPVVLRPGGVPIEALRVVEPGIRSGADVSVPEVTRALPAGRPAPAAPAGTPGGASDDATGISAAGRLPVPVAHVGSPAAAQPLRSPGLLTRHYAPRARLVLVTGAGADVAAAIARAAEGLAAAGLAVGLLLADEDAAPVAPPGIGQTAAPDVLRSRPGIAIRRVGPLADARAVARALFAALRDLDGGGVEVILARDFGTAGLALAVRDRLARAAEGRVVAVPAGDAAAGAAAVARAVAE